MSTVAEKQTHTSSTARRTVQRAIAGWSPTSASDRSAIRDILSPAAASPSAHEVSTRTGVVPSIQRACSECTSQHPLTDELQRLPLESEDEDRMQRKVEAPSLDSVSGDDTLVQRATSPRIQAKLTVGPADDEFEREADATADRVMRMTLPEEKDELSPMESPSAQRSFSNTEHNSIRRAIQPSFDHSGGEVNDPDLTTRISTPNAGRALPSAVREFIEPRMRRDFSGVRVHDSSQDRADAAAVSARAFTYGNHIWIGPNESAENSRLMAHELTHVTQQSAAGGAQSPTHVKTALSAGGQPLARETRGFFEPRLNYDLSTVRIHTNDTAAESLRTVDAKAYTLGNDIVFGRGAYRPETDSGKRLLAHELAHVLRHGQQSEERVGIQRQAASPERIDVPGLPSNAPACVKKSGQHMPPTSVVPVGVGNQSMLRHQALRDAPTPGQALPTEYRVPLEARLGVGLAAVRLHTDGASAQLAERHGARALTFGRDIYFGAGAYAPDTRAGLRTLAHEVTHAVQFTGVDAAVAAPRSTLEHEARAVATAVTRGGSAAIRGRASLAGGPLFEEKDAGTDAATDARSDLATWTSPTDTLLVVQHLGGIALLPARDIVYQPATVDLAEIARAKPFVDRDLGKLLEVASVGAAGTRIVKVGARTGFLFDSGSDTRGVAPLVYAAELQAALADVGVTDVSQVRILHVHADHVNRILDVLRASPGARIVVPRVYLTGTVHPAFRAALAAVRADPAFGPTWNPVALARDRGGPDIARFRYTQGQVVVEQIAMRSALEAFAQSPSARAADTASFLTRLTNTTNKFSIVLLGDLRMEDMATFRTAMEAERVGSWNEFIAGADTLSGFSHHAGAFGSGDVAGLLLLLEATMFRTGRLRVVEQTNRQNAPSSELQARTDTIELMQRLGVELAYTDKPANPPAGSTKPPDAPSGAGASRDTLTTRGPNAFAAPVIASPHTDALARLRTLIEAGETIRTWRPTADIGGPEAVAATDAGLARIDASIAQLVSALRASAEAMARVRAQGARTATGTRDYTAAGGPEGQALQAAEAAIPSTTPAETAIGAKGFEALRDLRARPASTIPLRVAVHDAITRGVYSDAAFRYLLVQVDPATRDSALYGPRGGRSSNLVAFQRLRAQFSFQRASLPNNAGLPFEPMAVGGNWSRGRVATAKGASWLQLFIEAVNIATDVKETVKMNKATNLSQNVLPTVRRAMFWWQLGTTPTIVGVEDSWFGSPIEEPDTATVVKGLHENRWDGVYIKDPPFTDADILVFGDSLSYHVRNYDEFATLFRDSGQDAVRWVDGNGPGGWPAARWEVNTGRYETSGLNHVEDGIWVEVPKLTELMRVMTQRLIANTEAGLERMAARTAPGESAVDSPIGGFAAIQPPAGAPRVQYRIAPAISTVRVGDGSKEGLERTVPWRTAPVFYLHGVRDGVATVSAADFNTYAAIRTLQTVKHYDAVMHSPNTAAVTSEVIGNTEATIMIPNAELVPTLADTKGTD